MDGVRSSATNTVPSGTLARSRSSTPRRIFNNLVLISQTSVALCWNISSSIDANICAYISHTCSTAASAHIFSFSIFALICPDISGSIKSRTCPSRISASFSPTRVFMSSAMTCVLAIHLSSALLKRSFSETTSLTDVLLYSREGSFTMTTEPIPIPADAPIPVYMISTSIFLSLLIHPDRIQSFRLLFLKLLLHPDHYIPVRFRNRI